MDEKLCWLAFSVFPGVGPGRFAKLLAFFGNAQAAWEASHDDLLASGLGEKLALQLVDFRKSFDLDGYMQQLTNAHVFYVTLEDPEYPELLKQIPNPPFVLYGKGNREILKRVQDDTYIAIVGTRKITQYGRQVTELLTGELAKAGYVIVSGLALGVDAVAHETTLVNGGKTIAVLGCGVDCCTPHENQSLYNRILEKNGLIVSEYPLSNPPSKGSFLSRNRIIAGLSQGVLVTEGAADSGSLKTAADGFAYGRKVFAVPGPITSSLSEGPSVLIKKGATLITNAQEVLSLFGSEGSSRRRSKRVKGETPEEQQIIDALVHESLSFDQLIKQTQVVSSVMGSLLSVMEIKGVILRSENGLFSLPA
ncbi:MAG: DNA-processing protein DprA [Patescibacteria group bacterium]